MTTTYKQIDNIRERDVILWINICLFSVGLLLLFSYIMMANTITAKNFKAQILRDKIETLTDVNGILISQKLALEDPAALLNFARSINLVEAGNILYIFEGGNVALQK